MSALADRYRLERTLGQGGMATVYLARDLRHDREVALKVLRPDLAAALGADRFVREIATTASLQHPNILPLFDSGEADGFVYYTMPYVDGESLRDRLNRQNQLDVEESIEITSTLAGALAYAHARGVVHRDIKPENIMFSSGQPVLVDFGIARAIDAAGGAQLTATGTAVGTPAYMSPEQSVGEAEIDGRTDQYALASVLYEMLAGEPPFTGPTASSIIAKRLSGTSPSVRVVRDVVSDRVDRVLQRALQRTPADRFSSITAFADALRVAPASAAGARRTRIVLGVIAATVLVVVVFASQRARRVTTELDANVIAVLPFRVNDDPSIAYLRESMLDLLNARLNGESIARTVEPRTTLAAWRRMVRSESEDLSEDESRRLAEQLGAGRVLLGSAIATPTELTLSGTLLRVSDGDIVANESVSGDPDSIAVLVNRLTARLLSLDAGESRERLDGLAATSLDALQAYLAGRSAYRRGDYYAAMDLYARAFASDSSFVQAAFGLVTTNPLIGTVVRVDGLQAIPTVWRLRERMSARDVALFLGMGFVGPNYPAPSTYAEIIAQAERAAANAPDSPEHWMSLGSTLARFGAAASIRDWPARAADALDRAIALDSTFTPAVETRLYVAMSIRDLDATRRLARLLEAPVGAGSADAMMLWAAAATLGDSATAHRWTARALGESQPNFVAKLVKIPLHSVETGLPLDDARRANAMLRQDGATEEERAIARLGELALEFAEGTFVENADLWLVGAFSGWWDIANLMQQAIVEPAYIGVARESYRRVSHTEWPPVQYCFNEMLRTANGDTSTTRSSVQRLRAFASQDAPPAAAGVWTVLDFRVCPLLLEAMLVTGTPNAALDSLDALMRGGPRWLVGLGQPATPVVAANWIIARMREEQGDIPAALAAIRRRENSYYPAYLWTLPAFLRQEGRLAALAGDTAGAIRAYDQYLLVRTDPDPPFRAQLDSVRAERAALGRL